MEEDTTCVFSGGTSTFSHPEGSVSAGSCGREILQRVILTLIFSFAYLLETFDHNVSSFIIEYLVFGTFLGAAVQLKWPGSNAHAILILSDLNTISRLLVLFALIPFVSVVRATCSSIISRLHPSSRNLQDATSKYRYPGVPIRFAIPSATEITVHRILPCMNAIALLPKLLRVRIELTSNGSPTMHRSRVTRQKLSMAGSLVIEMLTILSNVALLEIAAKSSKRLVLAYSKSAVMEILKLCRIFSPFGRLLNSIVHQLKVTVHRHTLLIICTYVSELRSFILSMIFIYNKVADATRILYSIAGVSFWISTRLARTVTDYALRLLTLTLQLGPQILLGCSKATSRIQALAADPRLGEWSPTFRKYIDAFLRTPMSSLALFLRHSAISLARITVCHFEHSSTSAKHILAIARSTLAKSYVYAALRFLGLFKLFLFRLKYHWKNTWSVISRSKVTLYDLVKFVYLRALISWHAVIMRLVRFTGLAAGISILGSVHRVESVLASLLEMSLKRLGSGVVWSSALVKGHVRRFVLPIYHGCHHQKCLIMWRAFRVNLTYILCVMISYFLLLMIARYTLEKRASRKDAVLQRISDYRPETAQNEMLKTLEVVERHEIPEEESILATPDVLEEERQKCTIVTYRAATVAPNFVNCDGLGHSSDENDKLCVARVNEVEPEPCEVEEYAQGYGLEALLVEEGASRATGTNTEVRFTISYVFKVLRGLEAARLRLKQASEDIENISQVLATAQTHHFAKIGHNYDGQHLYGRLYDGDLNLIDFLSCLGLTDKDHHSPQTQLLPFASLLPPLPVEVDVYRTDELNKALDDDLRAVELSRDTVQRELNCDDIGAGMELDFENLPQSASACSSHRPARTVQGEKRSPIACVGSL